MPKTTMREETEYSLPAGVYFPARLDEVTERTIKYFKKDEHGNKTNQEDSFVRWTWKFKITDGEYEGMTAYGDTEDRLTRREDNKVRQWAEALLNTEIQVGEDFDTDSVIGLPCVISVRHDPPRPRKDGNGNFYGCPVDEVLPAAGGDDDSPPF